jgi:hypothetical protein
MRIQTKLARLLVAGIVATTAGLATVTIVGAQSVPVDQPVTTAPPPQSPVEPPTNTGGAGNAGTSPAAGLPTAGTGADEANSTTAIALTAIAVALGGAGVASFGVARRRQ